MTPAQFQPSGAPGAGARNAMSTVGAVQGYFAGEQTMMDRASRLRMDEESHRLKVQQSELLRPLAEAKKAADIASERNKLASIEQMERMRAGAHGEMPGLRDAWAEASQIDDPAERVRAMSGVLGRASKYESVAELKAEVDVWKNVLASQAVTERTLAQIDGRESALNAKIAADRERDDLRAKHAQELAAVRGDQTRKTDAARGAGLTREQKWQKMRDDARASGDTETESLYNGLLTKAQAAPASTAEGSQQMFEALSQAEANAADPDNTPEEATHWQKKVQQWRERITALNRRGVKQDAGADAKILAREAKILGGASAAAPGAPASAPAAPAAKAPAKNPFSDLK